MPLRTFHRRIAATAISDDLCLSGRTVSTRQRCKATSNTIAREAHITPGKRDDFTVRDREADRRNAGGYDNDPHGLLAAVAGVSLLVAASGIMNIMLVSVTERTREIGNSPRHHGALEGQVLRQFLVEAVVLSLFGGLRA